MEGNLSLLLTMNVFFMGLFRPLAGGGGGRVGDLCTQNTDCQSGMFCQLGQCQCLSNHVAVSSFCWPKVNPGDSGCVEDVQCEAVWPGARCTRAGLCQCPEHYVAAKTRDGTVCVTSGVPPACPLPEPNNPEAPSPATLLANPSTHPLAPDSYMPVLCTSQSTEVTNSNGGDGSSWCVYPDGDRDFFIADLYNCVPHPAVRAEYFPEYAPSVDGICCPSRAFVCIQPLSQGEEPSVPRWWYNSVTGTCAQFLWDPSQSEGVSPNNFRTLEHCESYCRHTCRRGSAQFQRHLRAAIPDEMPVSNCGHQSGMCAPENSCAQIGSGQLCCPTIASLCSPSGGRSLPLISQQLSREAFDPGAPVAGSSAATRFYYDSEQGRCTNFLYEGGLGNFNNFGTKQDCENFCSKLVCEFGQPLRVAEGQWQRCESSSDCPSAFACDSGHKVCCPTAQTVCSQPKRVGECTGSVSRYWYNAATRQCELFDYTGCQGNDNNFEQLMECQLKCRNIAPEPKCPQGRAHRDLGGQFTRCGPADGCPPNHECHFDGSVWGCCPSRGWTCSMGPDRGLQCGAGRSFRFYFDADKQSCESFQYEGCDGNSNNFQSLDSCQDFCGVGGCPNGGQPLRDQANNQFLACSSQQPCPGQEEAKHECVLVNAHGSVAHRCCPTKMNICSQPPQPGLACRKGQLVRWYFNLVTRECGKFGFNGCQGNLNNFESQEQCQNFCSSAACSPGELVYRKERDTGSSSSKGTTALLLHSPASSGGTSRELVRCEPALSATACPRDFRCVHDQLAHQHVCCGAPPSDVCPPGEKPFWSAQDESVRECQAHLAGSCPANFLCRFSAPHNKYFCCAPRNGTVCPEGRALFRQAKSLQPKRCLISSASSSAGGQQCPDAFSCQSRIARDVQGHCCSTQAVCSGAVPFLVDERSQQPRQCIPGSFAACPGGFRCEKSRLSTVGQGICCREPATEEANKSETAEQKSDGCPPGESALFRHQDIVQCDPFNPRDKGCPRNYTCQYARMHQHYQCCAKRDILNGSMQIVPQPTRKTDPEETDPGRGCPAGQVAALDPQTKAARACTVSAPGSCLLGFSCQFSERHSQFQCCAHRAGCPGRSVAFVDSAGQARPCSVDKARLQCPPGFGCRLGQGGNHICCTLDDASASAGQLAISTTSTNVPPITRQRPREEGKGRQTQQRKKCGPNERLVNGLCRGRRLGDACLLAEHCPASMDCVDFACVCPPGHRPKSEKECEPEPAAIRQKGRKVKGGEEGAAAGKCAPGEILLDGECLAARLPLGARCRRSAQCQWTSGANCVSGRCRCTGNTVAHRNRCHRDVCGHDRFRLPQLGPLGEAVTCGSERPPSNCQWPHRCAFSRSLHTYICCRSATARIGQGTGHTLVGLLTMASSSTSPRASSKGRRFGKRKGAAQRCGDGTRPLLFPGSEQPVRCSDVPKRLCPAKFVCWRQVCCRKRQPLRLSVRRLPAVSSWRVFAQPMGGGGKQPAGNSPQKQQQP